MSAIEDAWAEQRRWSALADSLKAGRQRVRRYNLVLLIVGALAGAVAAQEWMPRDARLPSGVVAAIALALAGFVQQRYLTPEAAELWPQARLTSEAVKAELYCYVVHPDAGGEAALHDRIRAIEAKAQNLRTELEAIPVPDASPPGVGTLAEYVEHRAKGQQRWHHDKAKDHLAKAKLLHRAELATTLVATVLAAVASVIDAPQLSAWVAAATTVAAAVAAHVLAAEHSRVARSYLVTSDVLRDLIVDYERDPAAAEDAFVGGVERALLAQNEGWVALVRPG